MKVTGDRADRLADEKECVARLLRHDGHSGVGFEKGARNDCARIEIVHVQSARLLRHYLIINIALMQVVRPRSRSSAPLGKYLPLENPDRIQSSVGEEAQPPIEKLLAAPACRRRGGKRMQVWNFNDCVGTDSPSSQTYYNYRLAALFSVDGCPG